MKSLVKVLLLNQMLTSAITTSSWTDDMCTEQSVCTCEETAYNCICDNRENVTINGIFPQDISHILIKGCGTVLISVSLSYLKLKSIELNDLEGLIINQFALTHLKTVENLIISNVEHMDAYSSTFNNLENVGAVVISNVSWENVRVHSFDRVANTENFTIANSNFDTVQPLSFSLYNVTRFLVKNSHFGSTGNMALKINGSREVLFENCKFQAFSYNAFFMSFVGKLSFENCSFDVVPTLAIFATPVDSFTFSNCTMNVLESHAFENIGVLKHILFTKNTVNLAEKDSLYFSENNSDGSSAEVEKVIDSNRIVCDCNLTWLWQNEDFYKDFIDSSFCLGTTDDLRITSVSSTLRSPSECSKLSLKSLIQSAYTTTDSTSGNGYLSNPSITIHMCVTFYFSVVNEPK